MAWVVEIGVVGLGLAVTLLALVAVLIVWVHRLKVRLRTSAMEISRLHDLAARRADQVSVLSHEVRTPLALILGSAELLAEQTPGPLTPTQAKFVDTISRSAEHVTSLAEDLLVHARIEAGLFDVQLRQVELRSYLRLVVRELRQVYPDRRIILDAPGPPTRVHLDPHLIQQLVSNLVGNSLRHDDGNHTVVVRGHAADGNVILSISDQGRGMTEDERERLFARFSSGAPIGEGTGLGLYVSAQIAELHGGRILVDTIAKHGTTMLVAFPAGAVKGAA